MWTLDRDPLLPLWRATRGPGFRMVSTTRQGGISAPPYHALNLGRSTADRPEAVAENRRRVLAAVGSTPECLATAGQVHGRRVVTVDAPGHVPDCDALVTTRPGLVLAVTTADCMPLLYSAPGVVAVAHSGWRGTAAGMPAAALAAACAAAGLAPAGIVVHLGPCIRACCYEVGEEVAAAFPGSAVRRDRSRPRLDLPRAARDQLEEAGLPRDSVIDCGACTACEPEWYFSHRRDGPASGRHWTIAALTA